MVKGKTLSGICIIQIAFHISTSRAKIQEIAGSLSPYILPIANSLLFLRWWRLPRPISGGVPGGVRLRHDELPQPPRVGHHLLHVPALLDALKTSTLPRGFLVLDKRALGDAGVRVLGDPLWPPLVLRPMVLAPASVRVTGTSARRQGAAFWPLLPGPVSLFTRIQTQGLTWGFYPPS